METILAIIIMTGVSLTLVGMVQKATIASLRAREQSTCARMTQMGMSRLKNMDFYYLFAVDSSSSSFGLREAGAAWATYPYMAVLNGILSTLQALKYDRFVVSVIFMRRDTTDANHNGFTTDLIPFADNGAGVDLYDSNIKYFDQNGDGDYNETYLSGGRIVAEQPDTHIKQVTLKVYRRSRLVCSQTELISLEQFMAMDNPSSEAILTLQVSTPSNNAYLYQTLSAAQINSRAIALQKSYPSNIVQLRADAVSALPVAGGSNPLATVNLYVGSSGILDSANADATGNFSWPSSPATTNLVEGTDLFIAQATKGALASPLARETLILDVNPPITGNLTPIGTVNTLAPYVAVALSDPGVSTTTTSGICPDVITLKVNDIPVNFTYDAATGNVVWIDSTTDTVPIISSGAYMVYVEAGDYAGYKTTNTWSFTASVNGTDNSAPSISNKSPIGMAGSDLPVISAKVFDNQSGIIPSSIQMKVDGAVVVSTANIAQAYDASVGMVSFTPAVPFASGSFHAVEITASHFATDPPDKVTSTDAWNFTAP